MDGYAMNSEEEGSLLDSSSSSSWLDTTGWDGTGGCLVVTVERIGNSVSWLAG